MTSRKDDSDLNNAGDSSGSSKDIFSLDAIDDSWMDETDIFVRTQDGQVVKKSSSKSSVSKPPPAPPGSSSKPPPAPPGSSSKPPPAPPAPAVAATSSSPPQSIPGVPSSRITPRTDSVESGTLPVLKKESFSSGERSGFHYFVEKTKEMKLHGEYLDFGARSVAASGSVRAATAQTAAPAPSLESASAESSESSPAASTSPSTPVSQGAPQSEPNLNVQPSVPSVFMDGAGSFAAQQGERESEEEMKQILDNVDSVIKVESSGSEVPGTEAPSLSGSDIKPKSEIKAEFAQGGGGSDNLTPPVKVREPSSTITPPVHPSDQHGKPGDDSKPRLKSRLLSGAEESPSAAVSVKGKPPFKFVILGLVLIGIAIGAGLYQMTRTSTDSKAASVADGKAKVAKTDRAGSDTAGSATEEGSLAQRPVTPVERWTKDFEKGLKFYDGKDYEKAIVFFSTSIADDPTHFQVLHLRGKAYSRKKDYEKSIKDFNKALKLNRKNENILLDRAAAYVYSGDLKRAVRDYTAILKLNPDNAKASYGRGLAYSSLKKYDRARKDFQSTIDSDPAYLNAYLQLGLLLAGDDKNDEAIEVFTSGLRVKKRADLYYERSLAFYARGDYQDAVNDLTAAIKLDPDRKEYYNDRGYIYLKLGKDSLARADFQDALKIDPQYKLAKENLERVNQ